MSRITRILFSLAALSLVLGWTTGTRAAVIINALETGGDVVFSTQTGGSVDLTGLTHVAGSGSQSNIFPQGPSFVVGPSLSGPSLDVYGGMVSGPTSLGPGGQSLADSGSGDSFGPVFISSLGGHTIIVPNGYVSGAALGGTATYLGETFSSLGMTPGTYVWTLPNDTMTLIIGSVAPTEISVAYDFTASNFSNLVDDTAPPFDTITGSFGVTIEPNTGNTGTLEMTADFVNLSILGVDYTVDNTGFTFEDGDVNPIILGGLISGVRGSAPSTNDFWVIVFVDDLGDIVAPGVFANMHVRVEGQADFWQSFPADFSITKRPTGTTPSALLEQLGTAVTGVGPGNSLADKVELAQTYLAVPDVQATCAVMNAFLNQVRAQRGKKLTLEMADQLTTDAQAIMDAIGCN